MWEYTCKQDCLQVEPFKKRKGKRFSGFPLLRTLLIGRSTV